MSVRNNLPGTLIMFLETARLSLKSLLFSSSQHTAQDNCQHNRIFKDVDVSAAPQPPSLLTLPFEIRIQILRYLCPNLYRENTGQHPKAMREDGWICSTAILRINRQLYKEVREEWYGMVYYRTRIHPTGCYLHGYITSLYKDPPRTLSYIRYLDLEIQIVTPGWKNAETKLKPIGLYNSTGFLQKCCRNGGLSKLRKLRLRLTVSAGCMSWYRNKAEALKADVAKTLRPLRMLRGLTEVSLRQVRHDYCFDGMLYNGEHERETTAAMDAVLRDFVAEIALEMTLPVCG